MHVQFSELFLPASDAVENIGKLSFDQIFRHQNLDKTRKSQFKMGILCELMK
jgi:hypothetical protein